MAWADHDEVSQKALLIWTFFRGCGYSGEDIYFSATKHTIGAKVSITVKTKWLPSFHIIAGRVLGSPKAAEKRWGKIANDALGGGGSALQDDVLLAMQEPDSIAFFEDTLRKMDALGLPTRPEDQPA